MAARVETNRGLRERGERFESVVVHHDATVVLTGSWGRHEITSESDDDFMVVFEGSTRENARPSVEQVARILGGRAPGAEDIFGEPVALEDLRGKIGRDEDTARTSPAGCCSFSSRSDLRRGRQRASTNGADQRLT